MPSSTSSSSIYDTGRDPGLAIGTSSVHSGHSSAGQVGKSTSRSARLGSGANGWDSPERGLLLDFVEDERTNGRVTTGTPMPTVVEAERGANVSPT